MVSCTSQYDVTSLPLNSSGPDDISVIFDIYQHRNLSIIEKKSDRDIMTLQLTFQHEKTSRQGHRNLLSCSCSHQACLRDLVVWPQFAQEDTLLFSSFKSSSHFLFPHHFLFIKYCPQLFVPPPIIIPCLQKYNPCFQNSYLKWLSSPEGLVSCNLAQFLSDVKRLELYFQL